MISVPYYRRTAVAWWSTVAHWWLRRRRSGGLSLGLGLGHGSEDSPGPPDRRRVDAVVKAAIKRSKAPGLPAVCGAAKKSVRWSSTIPLTTSADLYSVIFVTAFRSFSQPTNQSVDIFIWQESCVIATLTAQCATYMGVLKIFGTPWLRPRLFAPKFFMNVCSDWPCEYAYKIWSR